MSDEGDPQFDYALQVRNNRWRLVVGLPSMAAAATAVARIAKSEEATTVAVEVYDPIKGTYQRKDRLTFQISCVVWRNRWARQERVGGPSGPALP